jgi:hypothetical protein
MNGGIKTRVPEREQKAIYHIQSLFASPSLISGFYGE